MGRTEPVGHTVGAQRLVAEVVPVQAGGAFLLDVGDLPIGTHLAITPQYAPAAQRREPEQFHQAHVYSVLPNLGLQESGLIFRLWAWSGSERPGTSYGGPNHGRLGGSGRAANEPAGQRMSKLRLPVGFLTPTNWISVGLGSLVELLEKGQVSFALPRGVAASAYEPPEEEDMRTHGNGDGK